jgi:hypothetical protein
MYTIKLLIILYPPFLIFAIIHAYAIRSKERLLTSIQGLEKWHIN